MTKRLSPLLSIILMGGCLSYQPYSYQSYRIGRVDSCNVGSSLVLVRDGWRVHNQGTSDSAKDSFLGFESEILYTGISGSTIHLVYREYQTSREGILIRPSYTLPVQYDISLSRRVSFRSYLLEILSADPSYMKFRVLKDQGPILHNSSAASLQDSLNQQPEIKDVPTFLPPNQRKLVKMTTVSGVEYVVYLAGESKSQYYFSTSAADTAYSKSPKSNIKSIVPVK